MHLSRAGNNSNEKKEEIKQKHHSIILLHKQRKNHFLSHCEKKKNTCLREVYHPSMSYEGILCCCQEK